MEPEPVPGYSIHQTPTGDFYYVNKRTGESQWERPPPDHTQPPLPPMPTPGGQELPRVSGSVPRPFAGGFEDDEGPELMFAKGAIVVILLSLFMPYISVFGIVEMTGLDIIVESIEILDEIADFEPEEFAGSSDECPFANDGECDEPFLCETGTDGADCAGTDSGEEIDIPIRYFMIMFGAIMVILSPFFFLLSAIISSVRVFSDQKLPKIMGRIHFVFFIIMFVMLAIGQTVLYDFGMADFTLVEQLGAGLWLGGLASMGLFIEKS